MRGGLDFWGRLVSRIRGRQRLQPCVIYRQKKSPLQRRQKVIPMVLLSMVGFCRRRQRVFLREGNTTVSR